MNSGARWTRMRSRVILSDSRRLEFNKSRIKLGRIPVYSRRLAARAEYAVRMWNREGERESEIESEAEESRVGIGGVEKAFVLPILSHLSTYLSTYTRIRPMQLCRKLVCSQRTPLPATWMRYPGCEVFLSAGHRRSSCIPFFEALDCGGVTCALTRSSDV